HIPGYHPGPSTPMGRPNQKFSKESNSPPETAGNACRKHMGSRSDTAAPDLPSCGASSTPLWMLSRSSPGTPSDSKPNPYQSHGGHDRRFQSHSDSSVGHRNASATYEMSPGETGTGSANTY
ncbi:uncharacterized protein EURHEDRAFT_414050, partial [Aspergillus ruber CBS 135680]